MRYLIDTHIFLWWLQDSAELSKKVRALIADSNNEIFLSIASVWEISIKLGIGKLSIKDYSASYIERQIVKNKFQLLPITIAHAAALSSIPQHHRDPFDRMLISQASDEELVIMTKDSAFSDYDVKTIW